MPQPELWYELFSLQPSSKSQYTEVGDLPSIDCRINKTEKLTLRVAVSDGCSFIGTTVGRDSFDAFSRSRPLWRALALCQISMTVMRKTLTRIANTPSCPIRLGRIHSRRRYWNQADLYFLICTIRSLSILHVLSDENGRPRSPRCP